MSLPHPELEPVLRAIAEQAGLTFSADPDHHGWSEPHYTLGWISSHGQTCLLEITAGDDANLYLTTNCWERDGLVGRQGTAVEPNARSLRNAIAQAKSWTDTFEPESISADGPTKAHLPEGYHHE